ncbi:MAG TPA: NAD-dependent epimerase/dehydratase family protein [Oligoflexus sp.]|uniref:NAD-dependent epimerase/dehydratase family protein n=1 Tax=Oligoflexus sp. TaxID=1971216 RepID=UPI002D594B1D|nr:NAD-dependent epimerase/dehydratase family protein [Oligoflexus sp.]HYX36726.1 NAD-dependent epimerase/dehydratase family protein [Oligoflexus sp.]
MKVLVTGADGFVGRHLVRSLEQSELEVIRGVRLAKESMPAGSVALGDISELSMDRAAEFEGVSAIIHLAGFAHQPQKSAEQIEKCFKTNVEGTRRIVEMAKRISCGKVIYLSSIKAHGHFPKGRPVSESDRDDPDDSYGISKLNAERLGMDLSARYGIQFVSIRPPLIYGPNVGANFLNLIKLVDLGPPLPFKSIANQRSLCFVGNLVDAIERIIHNPSVTSGTFYIADARPYSTRNLLEAIAASLDRRIRLFSLPQKLVESSCSWPKIGSMIEKMVSDSIVDTSKLRSYLNWEAPFSTDEGIRRTCLWYAHELERRDKRLFAATNR